MSILVSTFVCRFRCADQTAATDVAIVSDLQLSGLDGSHGLAGAPETIHERNSGDSKRSIAVGFVEPTTPEDDEVSPTEEEKRTLRKVAGPVSWSGYILCFIEGANNASYYGVTGVFANFIQRPLPESGNGWVRASLPVMTSSTTDLTNSIDRELLQKARSSRQVPWALVYKLPKPLPFCSPF